MRWCRLVVGRGLLVYCSTASAFRGARKGVNEVESDDKRNVGWMMVGDSVPIGRVGELGVK